MTEPILETTYWKKRLDEAKELHHSVFRCDKTLWLQIETKHRDILASTIGREESVLDCGCGWGRLLTLMPDPWVGDYLGIDLSPDFIRLAVRKHPTYQFMEMDLRHASFCGRGFDWAILISIRPMVKRNLGNEIWSQMEAEIRKVANKLLYLEYDPSDNGSVE